MENPNTIFAKFHLTLNIGFTLNRLSALDPDGDASWERCYLLRQEMDQDLCGHLCNTLAATCRPTQLCKIH